MAPIKHIVQFAFKDSTSHDEVRDACAHMLRLQEALHPDTQQPYIKSISGGKDNSQEGLQNGIQYAFIVEFEDLKDRDYYVNEDPTHQAFKETIGPIVEKVIVVDYTDGVYD